MKFILLLAHVILTFSVVKREDEYHYISIDRELLPVIRSVQQFHVFGNTNSNLSISTSELTALFDLYSSTRGMYWTWSSADTGADWVFDLVYDSTNGSFYVGDSQQDPCGTNYSGSVQSWKGIICNQDASTCYEQGSSCFVTDIILLEKNVRCLDIYLIIYYYYFCKI